MVKSKGRRTYVLDTSVLLADPAAITRFDEHKVVLPVVVITELEAKRHHPELGYFARQALRHLDDLRIEHGRLDAELPVGTLGGTVQVELNHSDASVLPAGFRLGDNDSRILAVACSLAAEGEDVVLVSKEAMEAWHRASQPKGDSARSGLGRRRRNVSATPETLRAPPQGERGTDRRRGGRRRARRCHPLYPPLM